MAKVKAKIKTFPDITYKFLGVALGIFSMAYLFHTLGNKFPVHIFHIVKTHFLTPGWIFISLALSLANWLLRIYKWKITLQPLYCISWKDAVFQQLTAFSWSVFTPFNAGEFVHKPLFFSNKKQVMVRVGYEQAGQMAVTVLAGIAALLILSKNLALLPVLIIVLLAVIFSSKQPVYLSHLLFLSFMRYISFALFLGLGLQKIIPVSHEIWLHIPLYFLAVSLLPLLPWLDIPVKGALALLIFQANPDAKLMTVALIGWLWLWNTFLPAFAGQVLWIWKSWK